MGGCKEANSSIGPFFFWRVLISGERQVAEVLFSRDSSLFGVCEKAPKMQIFPNTFVLKFMVCGGPPCISKQIISLGSTSFTERFHSQT